MTDLLPTIHLGEVRIRTSDIGFFGEVYVCYGSETYWSPVEFIGIVTEDGMMYRGKWRNGPEFDKLSKAFEEDPRLVELALALIQKRLSIHRRKSDDKK